MVILRVILFPVSLLYGIVTFFRNKLFDWGLIRSQSFDLPIISVGNISAGGTGKTPHVEYLVNLLHEKLGIAILSRGYKRKTKGFLLADKLSGLHDIGDEPMQFISRFDDVLVAVDESRVHGIEKLMKLPNPPETIILDDAFQHRRVKPGLSLLLTDYYSLYTNDYMLPTGTLREFAWGAKRADSIIVTKSPKILSPFTRQRILAELKPAPHQQVFFSYIRHGKLEPVPGVDFIPQSRSKYTAALLVAGIANPYPLEMYLKEKIGHVETIRFPDHHEFTKNDIESILTRFDRMFVKNKILITTEKDMMRFKHPELLIKLKTHPFCYVPIEIKFNKDDREGFHKFILNYVEKIRGNNSVYQAKD